MLKRTGLILSLLFVFALANSGQVHPATVPQIALSETHLIRALPELPGRMFTLTGRSFRALDKSAQTYRSQVQQIVGDKLAARVEVLAQQAEQKYLVAVMDFESVPDKETHKHSYWRFVIAESGQKRELEHLRTALKKSDLHSVILLQGKRKAKH